MRGALLAGVAMSAIFGFAAIAQDTGNEGDGAVVDELHQLANDLFEPIPSMVPAVEGNAITREKVELGKMLFFDPRLSASGILSCNFCHNLAMGGGDNIETSVGHGWQRGPRNSPTVLNAVFNIAQFWDGRAEDLRTQAQGPIQADVEMAATPSHVLGVLNSMDEYRERFALAFPNEDDPVTFDNVGRALEAFQATLITPASRFDQYLEGNLNALTDREKEGLELYINTGCASCHAGVNLGGQDYFAFGVVERPGADILPPNDRGRFAVTQTASDEYVFRAVPLRNVELTAPYFHSGKVWDLEQAVAIMGVSQLGAELTDDQVSAITAFLRTLTGEQPQIELPLLPVSTQSTPKPAPQVMTATDENNPARTQDPTSPQ